MFEDITEIRGYGYLLIFLHLITISGFVGSFTNNTYALMLIIKSLVVDGTDIIVKVYLRTFLHACYNTEPVHQVSCVLHTVNATFLKISGYNFAARTCLQVCQYYTDIFK